MNDEWFLVLLGILVVLVLVVCVFVLPILALVRTRRLALWQTRLERLERAIEQDRLAGREPASLPTTVPPQPATQAALPATPLPVEQLTAVNERLTRLEQLVEQRLSGASRQARPTAPLLEVECDEEHPRPRTVAAPATIDPATLEAWIGRHALGWVAVVLLLFATAFFLKYAFEHRWISELVRITMGTVAGVGLCGGGLVYHRRGWHRFSQMLTAAGVVLLYLAVYASFGYYHLLPQTGAAVFLVVLVAETAALAVLYDAPAIALMAVVGGLLTPLLLHADRDQYRSLFTYLAVLNAGVVGLALFRSWRFIGTTSLLGTQLLFELWYEEWYHPEKLGAALAFQTVLFGLYLGHSVAAHVVRKHQAGVEDLLRLLANAFIFFGIAYQHLNADYHVWMGTLAVAVATVYAAVGWLVLTFRPEDSWLLLAVVATAMGFVALAFPLQAEAAWIPVGWAVQGLALWWFGLRLRGSSSRPVVGTWAERSWDEGEVLRGFGAVLLVLAIGRLLLVDTPYDGREPFVPIFNRYGLPATVVAACVLASAVASRRAGPRDELDEGFQNAAGLGGILLLWVILSVETHGYFLAHAGEEGHEIHHLERTAQAALSVVWAVYAAVILGLGFRLRSLGLRGTALALFGMTVGKVLLWDMAGLPGLYRVAAFFVAALMLGVAAWAYQKFHLQRRLEGERP